MHRPTARQRVTVLAAIQAGDAIACAIPLAAVERDLDRLGCPPAMRRAIPLVKAASAAGLIVGHKVPSVGRLTIVMLVIYFALAIGAHARLRDEAWRYAAAVGMMALVLRSAPAYR